MKMPMLSYEESMIYSMHQSYIVLTKSYSHHHIKKQNKTKNKNKNTFGIIWTISFLN